MLSRLTQFLNDFRDVLSQGEALKLDAFITEYEHDESESIATFTTGLKKDYEAVKNSLLYPDISNGPMEGTNNKIKMIRKRSYGRSGIELLNALLVLPWYYRDLDAMKSVS